MAMVYLDNKYFLQLSAKCSHLYQTESSGKDKSSENWRRTSGWGQLWL